jgi:hypothetical protein
MLPRLPQAGALQVICTVGSQQLLLQDSSQGIVPLVQPQQLSTMLWVSCTQQQCSLRLVTMRWCCGLPLTRSGCSIQQQTAQI